MSRLLYLLLLLSLLLTSCAGGPHLKVNRCNYQGRWNFPKFSKVKIVKYQKSWPLRRFAWSTYSVDLAKEQLGGFSCHHIKIMQVRLYKTAIDQLLNLIPFYYSTHIEVVYAQ